MGPPVKNHYTLATHPVSDQDRTLGAAGQVALLGFRHRGSIRMALRWRANSLEDRRVDFGHQEGNMAAMCGSVPGRSGRGIRSSLSMHIYGMQRKCDDVEYDHRLEELKATHLNNMAQLERMYIRRWEQDEDGHLQRDGENRSVRASSACRKLQRINSQEELDFNETSSGSDQSELSADYNVSEVTPDAPRMTQTRGQTFNRESVLSPEDMMMIQKHFRFQPKSSDPITQGGVPRQRVFKVRPGNSKATVPKPFQMMLREVRKVRTRSEVELENALLRRELDELRECQKKFRASPAPAHVRQPLYDIISRRPPRRANPSASAPQPFCFLERERKKRESKMAAELAIDGGLRTSIKQSSATPGNLDASSTPRNLSSKGVKKKLEVSIELVKATECSHMDVASNRN
ncbi:protein FAM161A [Festucalex cinctus]